MYYPSKETQIEIVKDWSGYDIKYALFDFDGTVSLVREGWQDIMIPYFEEVIKETGTTESDEEIKRVVTDFVDTLTGKQTIFQCIQLDEEVIKLGERLKLNNDFLERDVNLGFSGGEVKRSELLQLLAQQPDFIMFDEPDSGVDIENVELISNEIGTLLGQNDENTKKAGKEYTLKFSVGYKRYSPEINDVRDFIAAADEGLYMIKKSRPRLINSEKNTEKTV
jgi:hypothetical protein